MNAELQNEISKLLKPHPDAAAFLYAYRILCHQVDDLIDRDKDQDCKALTLDAFNQAIEVYSSPFYQRHLTFLYPLVKNMHRVWQRSVAWEQEPGWKGQYADTLRCCGIEMTIAVLEAVCKLPFAEVRRLDALTREECWTEHHDAEGKPI